MTQEDAIIKAAQEYQQHINDNNPQAEAYDFESAFIAGAVWMKKHLFPNAKWKINFKKGE